MGVFKVKLVNGEFEPTTVDQIDSLRLISYAVSSMQDLVQAFVPKWKHLAFIDVRTIGL
jgi:hypothetical protein